MIDPDVIEMTVKDVRPENLWVRTVTLAPCLDCGVPSIYPQVEVKLCGGCLTKRAYTDAVLERALRDQEYAAKLKIALGG